jgi:parvulin-like peptidyl-prolyl isomerase
MRRAAACASLILSIGLASCGGSTLVASVGDRGITKADFDDWLPIYAIADIPTDPDMPTVVNPQNAVIPQPPKFTQCIADYRTPTATLAQLRQICRLEYMALRDQVLQFLIPSMWLEEEAAARGVTVSAAEVERQLNITVRGYSTREAFDNYLKHSGLTLEDLRYKLRLSLLSNELRQSVTNGRGAVTAAQVAAYYQAHKASYNQPELGLVRLILAENEAAAREALSELKDGLAWATVGSSEPGLSTNGSQPVPLTRDGDAVAPALASAVFAARIGVIGGPVRTPVGYYVFEVTKILPGVHQTLTQAHAAIAALLVSQDQQRELAQWTQRSHTRLRLRTTCARGYVVAALCGNAQ